MVAVQPALLWDASLVADPLLAWADEELLLSELEVKHLKKGREGMILNAYLQPKTFI